LIVEIYTAIDRCIWGYQRDENSQKESIKNGRKPFLTAEGWPAGQNTGCIL